LAKDEVFTDRAQHSGRQQQSPRALRDWEQGRGLGSVLLAEALRKAYENAAVVGSTMIVVDAIDERAADFYQAHGFLRLPESMRLILPMRTIEQGLGTQLLAASS
jgi:predicted GNAT family N-acyltransferase